MRIAAGIEYDGTGFSGWQIQPRCRSVQAVVEQALSGVAAHSISVTGAGRTDAGVHACEQVIHFDSDADRAPHAWVFGANSGLPDDVSLLWAVRVDSSFHARHSALERTYRYWILNRGARSALTRSRFAWFRHPLDVARMQAGADYLIGEHDFSAFRAADCQARSPMREVTAIRIGRWGECVGIEVRANAFLHHMVRNIVGVLLAIGRGEQPAHWAAAVLEGRDRRAAGVTAPPQGLYLRTVKYPEAFALPQRSVEPLRPALCTGDFAL